MSLFFSAIPYFLAAGTIALAGFTLVKEWKEYESTWLKRSALIVLIVVGALTFVSLYRDNKDKQDERRQAASDIEGLKGQVTAASNAQERNTKEFLKSFKGMSDQVATLQTEVRTEALQKKLASVQEELQKTQKAMAPGPKAELIFSFVPYPNPPAGGPEPRPVVEKTLPMNQDGNVHVEFTVMNLTKVDAIQVEVVVQICDGCRYAKEPDGLTRLPGMSDLQRYLLMPAHHAMQAYKTISVDVVPPQGLNSFDVGFSYRCQTCVLREELSSGTVHIAGR